MEQQIKNYTPFSIDYGRNVTEGGSDDHRGSDKDDAPSNGHFSITF